MLVLTHAESDHEGLRQRYVAALEAAGYATLAQTDDATPFQKGDSFLRLSITPAGPTSVVTLQRRR